MQRAQIVRTLAALAIGTLSFSSVAIVNGFPLLFSDSGAYLESGATGIPRDDRPIWYGSFLTLLHGGRSLWPVVVVQASALAASLLLLLRALAPGLGSAARLAILALTAAATAAPWIAGQVMPDFALPVLFCLLVASAIAPVSPPWLAACAATEVPLLLVSQANAPIVALFAALAAPGLWTAGHHAVARRLACCAFPAVAVAGAVLATEQFERHGRFDPSSSGVVFVAARWLADGTALDQLDTLCGERVLALCPLRAELRAQRTAYREGRDPHHPADYLLWEGKLAGLGGWRGFHDEAALLVRATWSARPFSQIACTLQDAAAQFVQVGTGDMLTSARVAWFTGTILPAVLGPDTAAQYRASRQAHDELPIATASTLHRAVLIAACGVAAARAIRDRAARPALAVLLAFLLANAVVTGAGSALHDRYQSRVAWLIVPMIAALELAAMRSTRGTSSVRVGAAGVGSAG